MTEEIRSGLRFLVGAGCFSDAAAALGIIARLPSNYCTGLGGLLVEEVDMLAACQIPDQRIVLPNGATTAAPSVTQVRALLRADARAFRRTLAQTAEQGGTEWFFAQDNGDLVGTALRAAAGWDILVLGYRQIHRVQGKVILFETSGATSDEVSRQLSRQLAKNHVVFSVREAGGNAFRTAPANTVQFDSLEEGLNALTRTNAQAVLVDLRHGPLRNQTDLSALLEAAQCPVIVLGASTIQLLLEHNTQIPPRPDSARPARDE